MKDKMFSYVPIRSAKVEDVDLIDPHEAFLQDKNVAERVKNCVLDKGQCKSFTILNKYGMPIAIIGGVYIFEKVVHVWGYTDKSIVNDNKQAFCYGVKSLSEWVLKNTGVERIQITVRSDMPWADRFAKFLGFKKEGVLVKYGEDLIDHNIYARVKEYAGL